MATDTLHKRSEVEPIDPCVCIPQASALISCLVANFGDTDKKDRKTSIADIRGVLEVATRLLEDGIHAQPTTIDSAGISFPSSDAREALLQAKGILRLLQSVAFDAAGEIVDGVKLPLLLSDKLMEHSLWVASDLMCKAEEELA